MSGPKNKVLVKMLDRLFAALVNGPGLNARPHNSRQRIDLTLLDRLGDLAPDEALRRLLGDAREVRVAARVPLPRRRGAASVRRRGGNGTAAHLEDGAPVTPQADDPESKAERAWAEQQALLNKLRVIADD